MTTKLTLALDETIVNKAKIYAKKQKLSLSKLVEFYFSSLAAGETELQGVLPPITAALSGMIKSKTLKEDKKLLTEILIEKHL